MGDIVFGDTLDGKILPFDSLVIITTKRELGRPYVDIDVDHVIAVCIPTVPSDYLLHRIYTMGNGWTSDGLHVLVQPADVERIVLRLARKLAATGRLGDVEGCEPWVPIESFDPTFWPDDDPSDPSGTERAE